VNPGYVDEPNNVPVALARVVGPDGAPTTMNVTFPFSGSPVTVSLDGTGSVDTDGRVAAYQWIASNPMMPMDPRMIHRVASPQVQLGQGTWTFSLWVTDDKGKVSTPSKVTFVVGMPTMPAGGAGGAPGGMSGAGGAGGAGGAAGPLTAEMCVAQTVQSVPMACRTCICNIESCRTPVIMSSCDQACWAFLSCIGMKCPTFAMDMNTMCLLSMCGAEYAAYSAGMTPMGATGAGACATMCANDC
jgi:hypothetical protein